MRKKNTLKVLKAKRRRQLAVVHPNMAWVPKTLYMMFRYEHEADIFEPLSTSSVMWNQTRANCFWDTQREFAPNQIPPLPITDGTTFRGLAEWQLLYGTYRVMYADMTLHFVNKTTFEYTLLAFPSVHDEFYYASNGFGYQYEQIDSRELPRVMKTIVSPVGSGKNSGSLSIRVSGKQNWVSSVSSDAWWGPFNPIAAPKKVLNCYWLAYKTGTFSGDQIGYSHNFTYRITLNFYTKLFGRKDVKNVNPIVSTVAHPEGEVLAPDA